MYFLFPKYLKVWGIILSKPAKLWWNVKTYILVLDCLSISFLQCFIKLILKKIFQFSVEDCLQSLFAEDDNSLSEMMMALMIFCWGRYFLYYDVFHLHNKKNDDKNTLYFKTEIHFLYYKDCRNYFLHMSFKTFQLIVNWEWWFQNE